jgi:RNA polymerase sigma factor (sigma-70 family)
METDLDLRAADAELNVQRLKTGDEAALLYFRKRLTHVARRCAYKHLASADDVAEAVETAILKLWKHRAKLPGDFSLLRAYFLRIVENAAIDILRTSESQKAARSGMAITGLDEAICIVVENEPLQEVIDHALAGLATSLTSHMKERELQIFRLIAPRLPRDGAPKMGQIYQQVGGAVGLDPLYVRNQWSRIQKRLKDEVGQPMSPTETRCLLRHVGEALRV